MVTWTDNIIIPITPYWEYTREERRGMWYTRRQYIKMVNTNYGIIHLENHYFRNFQKAFNLVDKKGNIKYRTDDNSNSYYYRKKYLTKIGVFRKPFYIKKPIQRGKSPKSIFDNFCDKLFSKTR